MLGRIPVPRWTLIVLALNPGAIGAFDATEDACVGAGLSAAAKDPVALALSNTTDRIGEARVAGRGCLEHVVVAKNVIFGVLADQLGAVPGLPDRCPVAGPKQRDRNRICRGRGDDVEIR